MNKHEPTDGSAPNGPSAELRSSADHTTLPVAAPTTALSPEEVEAYHGLQSQAVYWEAPLVWSSFRGDKAIETLNGLITNDVGAQEEGTVMYAAALSPKGKLVADMHVVRVNDTTLLIGVHPLAAPEWMALTKKYVNPRLSKVTDESATLRCWLVYGPGAPQIADALTSASTHIVPARAVGGVSGIFVIAEGVDSTYADGVQQLFAQSGARPGTAALWEVLRLESGYPQMGIDMDENTIPQEANLDALGAISFSKGCYTGQETVARVHFRGHVNKHLRGLTSSELLTVGANITDANDKVVGVVKSVAASPRLGPIALAMIRREVAIGASVQVADQGGAMTAQVIELPF